MSSNDEKKIDEKVEENKEKISTEQEKKEEKIEKETDNEMQDISLETEIKSEEETVSCLNFTEIKIEEKETKEETATCFSSSEEVKEEKKDVATEEEKLLEVEEVKYDESKLLHLGKILGELIAEEAKMNELKVNLKLTNEFIELMKKINEVYPDLLKEIDISLIDIIADKVIDSNDIPRLIVLVKNIYKKFSEQDKFKKINKITLEDSINFIKNLILILIELGHIKVNDKEKVILIIDLCIDLLTSSMDLGQSLFQKLKSCMC